MQLTWTNSVFSRIALVSRFCVEIQLSGKIPKNIAKILFYQKTHGARRGNKERQGAGLTTRGRGPALAVPTCGEAASAIASTPRSFRLHIPSDLKGAGVRRFSQIDFRCAATIRNRDSEPETLFWHPTGTGIWRRSSSLSSPTSLHQPSMTSPSMCE
jgi:hypothetical protein